MKNRMTTLVVMAAMAAAVSAQHVKVFDGRTGQAGAHGAGGGGGAGKVHVHDISIVPVGNAILAFPPQFQGGVRVAVGDIDGDGLAMLLKIAQSHKSSPGSFIVTFDRPIDPASANRAASQNNLKQLGLGVHNLAAMRIGLLKADGEGQMREYATVRATDVTLKRGTMDGSAQRSRVTSVTVTFQGLEVSPTAIGAANGGVWKTTNFVDPNTGEARIGLLLPAVQKIR